MILHAPGDCPDTLYGAECNGVGTWTTDPYAEEIYGEESWGWFCDGVYRGSCMDI